VLLPSCDNRGCVTGAISVKNDAGEVLLEHAYQATVVASTNSPPTAPVIIGVDQNNINNMLIVSPPPEVRQEDEEKTTRTALDINFLNQDLLKYNALDEDELKKYRELDVNYLDGELLANLLDLSTAQLAATQEAILSERTMLPGYSAASGLAYTMSDDESKLVLRRATTHVAQVTVSKEADAVINITQDSAPLTQQINRGGTTVITIIQK
jgi:hypothetical protein